MFIRKFRKSRFFGMGFTYRLFAMILFIVLSISGIAFSLYLFVIAQTLYMYVIAAAFFVLSLITGFFNSYAAYLYYKSYFYVDYLNGVSKGLKPIKNFPTIGIIIPIKNEDSKIVKKTLSSILKMDYPKDKMKLYMIESGDNKKSINEMREFCESQNINYIYKKTKYGKAGSLNNVLKNLKEEYVAVFDYDERLTNKRFLLDLLPYFEDPKVAFIQTEKTYTKGNLFSDTVSLFDKFFFNFIEPARALNNTALYAGSCGLIRKSVLNKTKGFPKFVIEDTFFSFEAVRLGYKSLYIPKVYAVGIPIKSFTSLSKQQWRYNFGDTEFLWYFLSRRKYLKSSWISHMDYIMHGFGLNYLSIIIVCFTIISVLIVFSAVPFTVFSVNHMLKAGSITMDLEFFGTIALFLSIVLPIILTKLYFKSIKKGIMIFALNYSLAIVRTSAAISVLLGKNPFAYWKHREKVHKNSIFLTLSNTKVELLFSGVILLLSYLALTTQNVIGAVWLAWYGIMYIFATIFVYKYG